MPDVLGVISLAPTLFWLVEIPKVSITKSDLKSQKSPVYPGFFYA